MFRPILRLTIQSCHFCKNYGKLYFDAKHLEKGWHRGRIFEKSALSGQYLMLP